MLLNPQRKNFFAIILLILPFLLLIKPPLALAATINDWRDCVTPEEVPTLKCLEVVFSNILFAASGLIVISLFIMFVVGSLQYLTSGGKPENIKKAQGTLKWALIGTLLFLGSYLILKVIDILFLGGQGNIFKFETP